MKSKAIGLPVSYRLGVVSRLFAAVLGGYLLASLVSAALAMGLPMERAEATVTGMMLSFLFYVVAILWCFACHSAWRAWVGVMLPAAVLAAVDAGLYWGLRT